MVDINESQFVKLLQGINLVDEGIILDRLGKLTCGQARIVAKRLLGLVDQQEMILKLRDEGAGIRDILETTTKKLTSD